MIIFQYTISENNNTHIVVNQLFGRFVFKNDLTFSAFIKDFEFLSLFCFGATHSEVTLFILKLHSQGVQLWDNLHSIKVTVS